MLGKRILDGVQAAGHPIRMAHSMVFVHIDLDGIRLTQLAERAWMTPQAMGELVDETIARVLEESRTSAQGCRRLLDLALENGGKDNVTVVLGRYRIPQAASPASA